MLTPISGVHGIEWPALPKPAQASLLAMLFQLEQTQWLSHDEISSRQQGQLKRVVEHAYRTVPFYRARFDQAGLDPRTVTLPQEWSKLPLLTRGDIQSSGASLSSDKIPFGHGEVTTLATSGSTGSPVVVHGTGITQFAWKVLSLREHVWHRRDFTRSFAAVRYVRSGQASYPKGQRFDGWGKATDGIVATGPGYLLDIRCSLEEQAEWLKSLNPTYFLTYPSVLTALANKFQSERMTLSNLVEVRTFGEIVEPHCRAACKAAWGVRVADMYSSQEVGYIALQCPETDNYHVQSENLMVEVLNENGGICKAGEIGRVVVTSLHNFAMPLLRYEIGDYAEVGELCPCGRGLGVLRRILGRQRNLLTLPDGSRRWPLFGEAQSDQIPTVQQFQVIQRSREHIEVKVVRSSEFDPTEAQAVKAYVQQTLGFPFHVTIQIVTEIPRSPSGKFEDFISLVE